MVPAPQTTAQWYPPARYDRRPEGPRGSLRSAYMSGPYGISPTARAHISKLARRSEGKGATDRTKYGGTRISTNSFYVHHCQMIAKAAVMWDARAIRKKITCPCTCLKQVVCTAAEAVAGGARA